MPTKPPFTPPRPEDHVRGAGEAPVTVIQYGDYECPHTRKSNRILRELFAETAGETRFIFRHFPLRHIHPRAEALSEAAEAAALQGRFWELHDLLMGHPDAPTADEVRVAAQAAGVDFAEVTAALQGGTVRSRVQEDVDSGRASRVHSTPSFFFNGVLHDGKYDRATVLAQISEARTRARSAKGDQAPSSR